MKVEQTDISMLVHGAFAVLEKSKHDFTAPFHRHAETELVYIKHGNGKRIIGDNIDRFGPGDIALIGAGLPHVWMPDNNETKTSPSSVVTYFNQSVFSEQFYSLKESRKLTDLLAKSKRGLLVKGETRELLAGKIERLTRKHGFRKIISVMEILHTISISNEVEYITGEGWLNDETISSEDRLAPVYQYINENYKEDISLNEIASVAHLTPPAFCRLFKSRTHKHFTEFLNEIRISHACNELQHTDETVLNISSACGFKTISNFNKTFKRIMGFSPKEYRHQYKSLVQ